MKINFLSFKPINTFAKQQNNTVKYNTVPLQYDTFEKNTVVFKSKNCSTANFEIKNLQNLHCPVCGYLMLSPNQQEIFANDIKNKKGEALIKTLEKYEDESVFTHEQNKEKKGIFNPYRQQVVNVIKDLASKNPTLELSQLVKMQADICIFSLIKEQLKITNELSDFVEKNTQDKEEKKLLKKIIQEYVKRIKGESKTEFSRKMFIYDILMIADKDENKEKIREIICKLPNSKNDINSFFVKYSKDKRTSKEIALKLVGQSRPTAEHLLPSSKNGANSLSNYLCDCADCNQKRGNTDFHDWQKNIPNFQQRLQEHLFTIQKALDKGELPDSYDSYIPDIINTIYKLSNGQIELYRPDSTLDKTVAKIIEKRQQTLASYQAKFDKIKQEKSEVNNSIKTAKTSPYYEKIISGKQTIGQIRKSINLKIAQLKSILKQHQAILDEQKQLDEKAPIQKKIVQLQSEIKQYSRKNVQLEKAGLANSSCANEYKNYLHIKKLYDEALEKRDYFLFGGDLNKSKNLIEILNYALKAMSEELAIYKNSEKIEYFINIEKMGACNQKLKELNRRLQAIQKYEQKTQKHLIALENELKGKTITNIKNEYLALLEAKRIIDLIESLPQLEQQSECLTDIIQHNSNILKNAQSVYKTSSNREFDELINKLYL